MASTFDPATVMVRNPREAAKVYQQVPKQRNEFIVRFHMNGVQSGSNQSILTSLTFVAKSMDRPKLNFTTQEMHQYNKKRQVYTGFKLEQLRMQFYDDAQSSALSMWQDYVSYYFGDIYNGTQDFAYQYDITEATFSDTSPAKGFGYTAFNNNAGVATSSIAPTVDLQGQYYFSAIDIFHFYNGQYDFYRMIHPRITQFEPDELDYESSAISLISLSFVYENLQCLVKQPNTGGVAEFQAGAPFDGNVPVTPQPTTQVIPGSMLVTTPDTQSSSTDVSQILTGTAQGVLSDTANYRFNGATSSGPLGTFGNFGFGPGGLNDLASMALNNSGLAATLNVGASTNPLAMANPIPSVINAINKSGIDGSQYSMMLSQANAMSSPYATTAINNLANSFMTNRAIDGGSFVNGPNGVVLSPTMYGAMNVKQSGTAQYGYLSPTLMAPGDMFGAFASPPTQMAPGDMFGAF